VGLISCSAAFTHEIFHSLPAIDYAVAYTESGIVLWVADGMADEMWSPLGNTPAETRQSTFDRFPELQGAW
jgi:hypothetical protein|tara:strand:+ start:2736 stop:2948 length:213 start_codon:yes stop_codon:yes gene_type:complete